MMTLSLPVLIEVKIYSLKVIGYHCAESSTALILEHICYPRTTAAGCRMQEVKGDIDDEKSRSELIVIQTMN